MERNVFYLIFAFIVLSASSFAQPQFGVKGGLSLANEKLDFNNAPSTDVLLTFHAGFFTSFSLSELFFIQPELLIAGKGFKYEDVISGNKITVESNPIYVQVPVYLGISGNIGNGTKIFAMTGPYLRIGITGKFKLEAVGMSDDGDLNWGDDENDDDYKRLDYGVSVSAGVETESGIILSAWYDIGTENSVPGGDSDYGSYTRSINISLGYKF